MDLVQKQDIVLGIDPGTNILGYSFVTQKDKKIEVLKVDVLSLDTKIEMNKRMKIIFDFISQKIKEYQPNILALEAPFYGKNVQSMLKLGRVQGICIASGLSQNIPFVEFEPKKVKKSITGNGNASKDQVMKMLQMMHILDFTPQYLDASDALAVGVTYLLEKNKMLLGVNSKIQDLKPKKKTLSWACYVNEHSNRVLKM